MGNICINRDGVDSVAEMGTWRLARVLLLLKLSFPFDGTLTLAVERERVLMPFS